MTRCLAKCVFFLALMLALSIAIHVYGHEGKHPTYTVTGLVTGKKIKNAAILNDIIVREGDTLEIRDGKLAYHVTPGGRVKVDQSKLITISAITSKGVNISHVGTKTVTVPLKARKQN